MAKRNNTASANALTVRCAARAALGAPQPALEDTPSKRIYGLVMGSYGCGVPDEIAESVAGETRWDA